MNEAFYSISDASQKLNVEAHVLRYWEDELDLKVPRNELGHRAYTDDLIAKIQRIKDLRQKGCSLKEVRFALDNDIVAADCAGLADAEAAAGLIHPEPAFEPLAASSEAALLGSPEDKLLRFQEIMVDIFTEAMNRGSDQLSRNISEQVSDQVVKEMDYLMQLQAEKQESHFRKLDETLRAYQKGQKSRAEAAATQAPVIPLRPKKHFPFFGKRT